MSGHHVPCGQFPEIVCKFMVGFISLTYNLIIHQIDITSRHFAVAFKIPIHNIGIYFDKLYCVRCFLFVICGLLENGIFQAAGGDGNPDRSIKVRKYVGTSAFGALLAVRIVYLLFLYKSSNLSFQIYCILSAEAFPYAIHDTAFMALVSEYTSIASMLFNLGRLFVFSVQFVLDMLWFSRPLLMIKMQAWVCVLFTAASVVLWYYYNFELKVKREEPNEEQNLKIIKIVKEPADSALDALFKQLFPKYYEELDERRKEAKLKAEELEKDDKFKHMTTEDVIKKITGTENNSETSETDKSNEKSSRTPYQQMCDKRIGHDGAGAAISPVMMYWSATIYKDFLYPGTLPYGLLARDKCHLINLLIPVFNNIGPISFFFLDNFSDKFDCWNWPFDLFWILYIPMPIIFVYAFLAIHTKIPSARAIINSRPRIMTMTLVMIISFGFMEPLSYIGVGKYAFRNNPHGFTLLGFHLNAALLCRSIFARLSVGYTDVRVKLGYHLPKFRPTHKMSDFNTFWFIFKNTFKRSLQDVKGDFKMDIKKYL